MTVYRPFTEGSYGILSHQAMLKIPGPYDKNSGLPLGNGQFDAGYRYRAEAPSDEFRYLAEIGVNVTKRLYARVKLDGILSVNNGDNTVDKSGNPTTIYQFDLQKLDTALGYKLTDTWGLELGYTPTLYGKNTAEGTACSVGVTYLLQ